jgi:hypothetical protein
MYKFFWLLSQHIQLLIYPLVFMARGGTRPPHASQSWAGWGKRLIPANAYEIALSLPHGAGMNRRERHDG